MTKSKKKKIFNKAKSKIVFLIMPEKSLFYKEY